MTSKPLGDPQNQTDPATQAAAGPSSTIAPPLVERRRWYKNVYLQRTATNWCGVTVGYIGLVINSLSGMDSDTGDWTIALAGALLIPVISRLSGAASRVGATPWVLWVIRWSSVIFMTTAIFVYLLAIAAKRHWASADVILRPIIHLWYVWVLLGWIFDLILVAAEEEKHEKQLGAFVAKHFRGIFRRAKK